MMCLSDSADRISFREVAARRDERRGRNGHRIRDYGESVSTRGTAELRRVARAPFGIDDSSRGESTVARRREIRSVLDAVAYARQRREVEAR